MDPNHGDGASLGNRVLLDKVDKLREFGVSATIPLPQVTTRACELGGRRPTDMTADRCRQSAIHRQVELPREHNRHLVPSLCVALHALRHGDRLPP